MQDQPVNKPPKQITHSQYLQLLGLKTLAEKHVAATNDIRDSVLQIIDGKGDDRSESFVSDFVWGDDTLDHLLDVLRIGVIRAEQA